MTHKRSAPQKTKKMEVTWQTAAAQSRRRGKPSSCAIARHWYVPLTSVTHPSMPATHEVQVEYIDGWSHPESDYLIWELERGARVVASLAIPRVDEPDHYPDDPALLHAFLRANQWSAINRLSPGESRTNRNCV